MKTVSQLLTYLESQGHGVTARELLDAIARLEADWQRAMHRASQHAAAEERKAIEAEKRVTVANIERMGRMFADMRTITKACSLTGLRELQPKSVYWRGFYSDGETQDTGQCDTKEQLRQRARFWGVKLDRVVRVNVYDSKARMADIERKVVNARAEERKRLQRAVAELREKAPHHIPQLLFHEALDAMGAILHVDSERGLTQWIDRETGDVVHERRG